MKICHVGFGGGVFGVMHLLQRGFPHHNATMVAFGPGPMPASIPQQLDCTWRSPLAAWSYHQGQRKLKRILTELHPDVVFLHGFIPLVFGSNVARSTARWVIGVDHGPQPTFYWPKKFLWRFSWRQCDRIVSVSHSAHKWFLEHYPFVDRTRALVIENGIEVARFARPEARRANDATFTIGTIARMDVPQKDPMTSLAAARLLHQDGRRFRWRFVGGGNATNAMHRAIRRWGLTANVELVDFTPEVAAVYHASDVIVLSTNWEGLPLNLVEALAARVPVIATDVLGVRDVIRDGHNGVLVPPKNSRALADALSRLMRQPQLGAKLAANGYVIVQTRFSLERMIRQYAQLLESLDATNR